MTDPTFVFPLHEYPSYSDFRSLVNLARFDHCHDNQIDLADPSKTYIFVTPESIPDCSKAAAHTIFWQFEYAGDYCEQGNRETVSETWASDPLYATENDCKFVLLGSDERLNFGERPLMPFFDVTMLAYMTDRRMAIYDSLMSLRWPEFYPGHNTEARHRILLMTTLMLHVHQHDTKPPHLAPIRLALAAAYHMPVACEDVIDRGVYDGAIDVWADYNQISRAVMRFLSMIPQNAGDRLYDMLCGEFPFKANIDKALAE